jgi:hypothetical protein
MRTTVSSWLLKRLPDAALAAAVAWQRYYSQFLRLSMFLRYQMRRVADARRVNQADQIKQTEILIACSEYISA